MNNNLIAYTNLNNFKINNSKKKLLKQFSTNSIVPYNVDNINNNKNIQNINKINNNSIVEFNKNKVVGIKITRASGQPIYSTFYRINGNKFYWLLNIKFKT